MTAVFRSFLAAAAALMLAGPALAAPQLLGTIATLSPLGLQCEGDTCRVEVATYCMQAHRDTPERNHAYRADDLNIFKIVAKDASGRMVEKSLAKASFHAARGYTVTTLAFSRAEFVNAGLEPVGLKIAKGGVLVPVQVANDPDPIDDAEVLQAKATLLPIADRIFKKHNVDVAALRLVNKVVSEIPAHGRLSPDARENVWESTFGESPREAIGVGASEAAGVVSYCQTRTAQGRFFSMRRCLEQKLDGMLMDINTDYWKATKPGY